LDGKSDERLEETKDRINSGAGVRGYFYCRFQPGLRGEGAKLATTQRRYSSPSHANPNSEAFPDSASQASDNDSDRNADSNSATHAPTNGRADSS